ncbi:MAG TPA: hypothetical protein VLE96_04160 [Chlamydiales bacterium]|nr:hypothetical protein [Chlamydiales bacterium]
MSITPANNKNIVTMTRNPAAVGAAAGFLSTVTAEITRGSKEDFTSTWVRRTLPTVTGFASGKLLENTLPDNPGNSIIAALVAAVFSVACQKYFRTSGLDPKLSMGQLLEKYGTLDEIYRQEGNTHSFLLSLNNKLLEWFPENTSFSAIMEKIPFCHTYVSICQDYSESELGRGSQKLSSQAFVARLLEAFVNELAADPKVFLQKLYRNEAKWKFFSEETHPVLWLGIPQEGQHTQPTVDHLKDIAKILSEVENSEEEKARLIKAVEKIKMGLSSNECIFVRNGKLESWKEFRVSILAKLDDTLVRLRQ